MKTVSLLEFRRNTRKFVQLASRGQRLVMTSRGKPILRLEPITAPHPGSEDPIYHMDRHAVQGKSLSNRQMDEIIYE